MATASQAEPVRFFCGILASDANAMASARQILSAEWGEPDVDSGVMPFDFTDYYREQTGGGILRAFLGFPGDFPPDALAGRKVRANAIEIEMASSLPGHHPPRPVNLDPGYLAPGKMVLASAKDFAHRVYLSDGIYAEVTLQYRQGRFMSLPWTFPDYASGRYDPFFLTLREKLMDERRGRSHKQPPSRT